MDAFFASVEIRDNPSLIGKPIAVGGSEKRGVVCTANYEARKYGVKSAISGVLAKKLCPDLIFVKPRFEVYKAVSNVVFSILRNYSSVVESLSLDEAYIDVSNHNLPASTIAAQIKSEIYEKTQLTASAGVSFNKFLAKVASDFQKPNGLTIIKPKEAAHFIDKLPIEKFFGVGKVTAEKMNKINIKNGGDLKKYNEDELYKMFGKSGVFYYKCANCIDERPVASNHIRKSVSCERTFNENLVNIDEYLEKLNAINIELNEYLIKKNIKGRTLTLKIKYKDFSVNTRSISFEQYSNNKDEIWKYVMQLLNEPHLPKDEVRLFGITLSNLFREENLLHLTKKKTIKTQQLSLPLVFDY